MMMEQGGGISLLFNCICHHTLCRLAERERNASRAQRKTVNAKAISRFNCSALRTLLLGYMLHTLAAIVSRDRSECAMCFVLAFYLLSSLQNNNYNKNRRETHTHRHQKPHGSPLKLYIIALELYMDIYV